MKIAPQSAPELTRVARLIEDVPMARRVDTGMRFVDNIDWRKADLPFDGVAHSGDGREPGRMGNQAFVNKKLVRSGHMAAPL